MYNLLDMSDDEDKAKHTYFAQKTKLNKTAMIEYDLQRLDINDDNDKDEGQDDNRPLASDNSEWIDRFDSRGQKMRIRRGQIMQGQLMRIGYSFAVINFHPKTLITQQDLKMRTTSVVFSKYKQIKREISARETQRRLLWFMSIVKCKAWAQKMLRRVRKKIEERNKAEAQYSRTNTQQKMLNRRDASHPKKKQ